jgi:hypothetical protein
MDTTAILDSLMTTLGESIPRLLLALAILVAGWVLAVIARALVRKSLGLAKLNDRVRSEAGGQVDIEGGVAVVVYYVVLLLALIAFFDTMELPLVSGPLQTLVNGVLAFVPNLVAGAALMLIAWMVATVLRKLTRRALDSTRLDERLAGDAGMRSVSRTISDVLYGLVLLMFLPAVLGALKLEGLLAPVRGMVQEILAVLPNLFAAVVFGFVGWFVARLLRDMVSSLASAAGADKLGERAGLRGTLTLSRLLGLIVFIFVFVPALIQALDALDVDAISTPATEVLGTFMGAVPNLFAAAVILAVAFFISEFVASLATGLLGGIGFDRVPAKLGLAAAVPEGVSPSSLVGKLIVFFVLLFAVVEAADVLGFAEISGLVETFVGFGGQVLLGVLIIGIGIWLANLAHDAIIRLDRPHSHTMAILARITILGLVLAMGLRAMEVANEIVNAAFYLTLGAVAVAFALSFGLGGREAAGKQMEHWLSRLRGDG